MDCENNVMRSKFLQGNDKLEYVFYNNKNSFEVNTESEAKRIFSELIQLTFSKTNTINLRFLRQLIDNSDIILNPTIKSFISVYKLTDQLRLGNKTLSEESGYDFDLTEKDFVELFTGKYIKDLLFESKSYEKKRHYLEEYSKLYELMGADQRGLSRKALFNTLKDSLLLAFGSNANISSDRIEKEVDEIIHTFSQNGTDYISLADFVNIITSDSL